MIPRIVEIVGLAGAGKTTLYHTLSHNNKSILPDNFPDIKKISAAPFFIWNGLQIFPALLHLSHQNSKKLTRREFAWLSILHGWPSVLQKKLKNGRIIILDQGPVYLLTETSIFGTDYLRERKADSFWQGLFSQWADTLDMIVWLDADDNELLKRIRTRDKEHVVKKESNEAALEFLAGYRKAYERTIASLTGNHPDLKILQFDTTCISPEVIANQLLLEFESTR